MAKPSIISFSLWKPGRGQETSKYLVNPGTVTGPGRHSAGGLRHARPYLANGSRIFVWPVGVEGFRRTGTATIGKHRYIGANAIDGHTIHYEEANIELSGAFPGVTAQDNMVDCISMLRSKTQARGLILFAPGVFEREQYVLPEDWEFDHAEDDRTHSITYRVTFSRIGEGTAVKDPHGTPPPPNPSIVRVKPKGKPSRIYVIKDGVRTLRAVANEVYGNQNRWDQIVTLNEGQLRYWNKTIGQEVPSHQLPTFRWPIGTQFRY